MMILLIHWTARITFVLYAAALAAWLIGKPRAARLVWTAGFLLYLAHVFAAFHIRHHWSHSAAYEETARQTAALFGVHTGIGLYFNYVFTALWALDVVWPGRPSRLGVVIHTFIAFMFFNATVVFVSGWVRWLGLGVTIALGILWLRARKT